VTPELIERVRAGAWNPERYAADRMSRDALAARGYWQAFQSVTTTIAQILRGADAAKVVRSAHRDWYRNMFQPGVAAGLIEAQALAGYRRHFVYLQGSRHVPPRWEAVSDAMEAMFDLLEGEKNLRYGSSSDIGCSAIFILSGRNGRIARFLMNTMLASGGYPWTVIRIEDRAGYMKALDDANVQMNIGPFTDFIADV